MIDKHFISTEIQKIPPLYFSRRGGGCYISINAQYRRGGWGVIAVVTVNAFTTVRSNEVGGMWRLSHPYSAPRSELKG